MLHVKSLLIFYLLKSTRQVFVCASQKVVIVAELTWTLQLIPGQECIVSTCSTCLSYSTCCFSYVLNYKYSNCPYETKSQTMTATMSWAFKVSLSHCSLFQKLPSFLVSLAFFFTLH